MTTVEEWRPVTYQEGFYADHYEVSNFGRVKSYSGLLSQGKAVRILKPAVSGKKAYPYVCLCVGGKRLGVMVHVLVAHEFIGPRPEGLQINHKNLNKEDNRAENLEYVTPGENYHHCMRARGGDLRHRYVDDEEAEAQLIRWEKGERPESEREHKRLLNWIGGGVRPQLLKRRLEATGLSKLEYRAKHMAKPSYAQRSEIAGLTPMPVGAVVEALAGSESAVYQIRKGQEP